MSKKTIPPEVSTMIKNLDESLKTEENRQKLEDLLKTFAVLERDELLRRVSSFVRYIEDITGENTANILLQLLSTSLPELERFLSDFKTEEVQKWLRELNFKYISRFEGIFPPFPHDWYRILWSIKLDVTHGNIPLIELKILKRNGETAYLEMPFPATVKFINYILEQISEGKNKMGTEVKSIVSKDIENTKKIVELILKD